MTRIAYYWIKWWLISHISNGFRVECVTKYRNGCVFFYSHIILFIDFGRWWIALDRIRSRTTSKDYESTLEVYKEKQAARKCERKQIGTEKGKKNSCSVRKLLYGTTFFAPPIIETRVFCCAVFMHIANTHFTCDKLKWLNAIVYETNNELIQ